MEQVLTHDEKLRKNDFNITSVDVNHILEQLERTIPQAVHYLDTCSTSREVRTFLVMLYLL